MKAAWKFLAARSRAAANALLADFDRRANLHAAQPGMGRRRDDLDTGVRQFVVGKYLALYRITSSGILVLRVIYGSRDIPAAFAADPGDD